MSKKIIFEIETITPMFLSGADQSKAELRAASIRGLLRFWWRALQAESDLRRLRERESRIFGSSDEKNGGGSSFSLRISQNTELKSTTADLPKHNISVTSKSRGMTFQVNILEYLAYGPCTYDKAKKRNMIVREYIQPSLKFIIQINIFREDCLKDLLMAMYVFELFGGVGSKSRNGFGGFSIVNKEECFSLVLNGVSLIDQYTRENLHNFIKQTNNNAYTSFTEGTRVFRAKELYNTWDKALGKVGELYRGIRSGDIKIKDFDGNLKTFEKHFKYDKRQYIASPIIVNKQEKSFLGRHAKPYFIKIAKEGDKYRAYILYLPSQYCIELNNAQQHDKMFSQVCTEFNGFLSQNMDIIL